MKKIFLLLLLGGFTLSCSKMKTTYKVDRNVNTKFISLEQFLTFNNNYIKIPITKMPSGHLHLNAEVNGVKGKFILDTGAGATIIDPKHLKKFHLQTKKTDASGAGAGGQTNLQKSSSNLFKIDKLEKYDFDLYLMNLDHVNNAFESMGLEKVDGIIGADILTSNNGIIDYLNLVLYLKENHY